MSSNL